VFKQSPSQDTLHNPVTPRPIVLKRPKASEGRERVEEEQ